MADSFTTRSFGSTLFVSFRGNDLCQCSTTASNVKDHTSTTSVVLDFLISWLRQNIQCNQRAFNSSQSSHAAMHRLRPGECSPSQRGRSTRTTPISQTHNLRFFWLLAFGTSFHSTSTKEPAHRALMGVAALACDQWRPCDTIETMRGASQKEKEKGEFCAHRPSAVGSSSSSTQHVEVAESARKVPTQNHGPY